MQFYQSRGQFSKKTIAQITKGNKTPSHNEFSGFQADDTGISLEKDQAFRFYTNKQASLETITESCDASSKNEKPSHNGASFKPGDKGIPLEKDQAFRFYTNKQASLETITESCDTSSENEKPSHNGVSFKPGDKGISLKKDQALRFSLNKPPEIN